MLQSVTSAESFLAHWHSTRPVFAVMGEYSAGKSTLLNFILGQQLFPTRITATNLPPIWLTYAETPRGLAVGKDGATQVFDPKDLNDFGGSKHVVLHLSLPIEILRNFDLLDTPGISDVRLAKKSLNVFAPYLDFVVWCSNASQAWRQTEKAMWKTFPPNLHNSSIFVLTQTDKLKGAGDLAKVMKRMEREALPFFSKAIAVSITDATDALNLTDALSQESLHIKSNVAQLNSALSAAVAEAERACEQREVIAAPAISAAPAIPTTTPRTTTEEAQETAQSKPNTITKKPEKEQVMANLDISGLSDIGGFIGACLVDSETGLMMASEGGGKLDLEAAGAANTEVVKAKLAAIEMLGLNDQIDDILITLGKQFHLIRPLQDTPTVFLYVALDKKAANLGMARVQVKNVEKGLKL